MLEKCAARANNAAPIPLTRTRSPLGLLLSVVSENCPLVMVDMGSIIQILYIHACCLLSLIT
jgi:hypothetical protein